MAMYTQVSTLKALVGLNALEYIAQSFFNAVLCEFTAGGSVGDWAEALTLYSRRCCDSRIFPCAYSWCELTSLQYAELELTSVVPFGTVRRRDVLDDWSYLGYRRAYCCTSLH